MIVYLARVNPAFVMYCVNGASRSSLLIESTDYDIYEVGREGCIVHEISYKTQQQRIRKMTKENQNKIILQNVNT